MIILNGKQFKNNETGEDLILKKERWQGKNWYWLSYYLGGDVARYTSAKKMMDFLFKNFK